ncbi:MAG: DUF1552 domain-containing protein [Archangium sp.]|nr:DUF1552 domain-containing protein [Archangium sp.]
MTLALPFFESLLPRAAWGQGMTRHRFLMVVRAGNGIVQEGSEAGERFWPRALGALTVADLKTTNADRATSVLGDYAQRLLMVKNVRLPFARNSCGHAEAIPQLLTAQNHTGGTSNSPLAQGRSVDWHLSDTLNGAGNAPLVFMAGPTNTYIGNGLSWSAAQQRAAAERSPLSAYMRLTGLASAPPEVQVLVANRRKSVNDLVRTQLRELTGKPQLSTRDKARLEQHLAAVRDMELQMTCDLEADRVAAAQAITQPESNDVRPQVVRSFMDLAAWAFNCRLNHVATLQVGHGNDGTQYTLNGTKLPSFHWISHRIYADGADGEAIPDAVELHHQIDRMHLGFFKHLLDRLDGYASPNGGTLLDDCAAVWNNDLGNGPPHDASTTPWIIAGGAGGTLRTGQVIDHQKKPVNQMLNTLINAMGVRKSDGSPTDDFGDATLAKGVVTNSLV